MIVHESLYDDFVAKFTEKMLGTQAGPLSSLAAAERLEKQVEGAVSEGASLASAGQRDGTHFPPGVLTGVGRTSTAYREELFGPVAMVFKVSDEAEAVEVANDTSYGWAPTSSPTTRSRPPAWPTRSTRAWSSSTAWAQRVRSCPSAG